LNAEWLEGGFFSLPSQLAPAPRDDVFHPGSFAQPRGVAAAEGERPTDLPRPCSPGAIHILNQILKYFFQTYFIIKLNG
jgi:hypothetical protein